MEVMFKFFGDLQQDVSKCFDNKSSDFEQRIASIALRVLGFWMAISACWTLVTAFPVFSLIVAGLKLIISHEAIVIGCNLSQRLSEKEEYMHSRALASTKRIAKEYINGFPYYLNKTWVIGPVYKAIINEK